MRKTIQLNENQQKPILLETIDLTLKKYNRTKITQLNTLMLKIGKKLRRIKKICIKIY
jgi:hypothetical protein